MFTNRRLQKGIIIVALLGILSFALAGCGGKEEPKKEEIKYPTKPISAICPWSAGGSSDVAFRGYLNYLKKELGQEINVTNITGGNGSIGWSAAAKADPDGYNMVLLTFDILTVEAQKLAPVTYRDFDIINMFTNHPSVLIVHGDSPWKTLDEFLEAAKKAKQEGKQLQVGVAGENGLWHQAGVVMEEATGTEGAYKYIPFKGSSDQLAAMLGKHLDAMITSTTASKSHLEAGTLRMLAVMGNERLEDFPDVPTFKDLGYNVVYESWRVLAVPKGTPEPILQILREAGKKAFENPEFQKWAKESDIGALYRDHEQTVKFMEEQYPVVEGIMKKFGLLK